MKMIGKRNRVSDASIPPGSLITPVGDRFYRRRRIIIDGNVTKGGCGLRGSLRGLSGIDGNGEAPSARIARDQEGLSHEDGHRAAEQDIEKQSVPVSTAEKEKLVARSSAVVRNFLRFAVSMIVYHRQILRPCAAKDGDEGGDRRTDPGPFVRKRFCDMDGLWLIDAVDGDGGIVNNDGKY